MNKTINNNELNLSNLNQEVILYGWVANKRKFGEINFVDLRDKYGITQLVFNEPINFSKESVLEVRGTVKERKDKNYDLPTGEIEVFVQQYKVLSSSKELPFQIRDDIEVKEELRLKYRFLDLRRPIMQKTIALRNKFIFAVREFLQNDGFLEIETPILSKATPEGARDFLVPTRNVNEFYALPQSPQLFKQLLMISGFEKYFQIARCFRDEDSRKDRQPEFTQLDIEVSFTDLETFQSKIEKLFKYAMKKVMDVDIQIPFQRVNYDDCIRDFGSDKPDFRYDKKIIDINDFCNDSNFNIIKNESSKRLLKISEIITKKEFKILEEIAKKNKANALFYFTVQDGEILESNFANKVMESIKKLINKFENKDGTYLIVANNFENASQSLGAVRVELNNWYKWAKDEFNFKWIVKFPMFEYDNENNKWDAAHHPFTQFDNTIDELSTLPKEQIKAKSYDLVLNGFELGSGSARIYDKDVQEKMFELIGLSKEEQEMKFGFFLNALNYGVPPHCGIGLGIDRIIMILANLSTIRDAIAFPKNSKNQDIFTNAPSGVEQKQLDELFISVKN
ncbi:aspartate--tRNA ligase [Mycoplasmopsis felis]|uniref:aspartate--tRNA ligase n=1 Tax=Mycoplasmopsis felis TaxID=33923 RepID=UPI002AFFB329|nr:aspartate--tRNA ligase [Mycoplasmopsis felis]WQQ03317.1 aspartate--tRNA ligase [Mycoplasmopsis felis]WQQ04960.1 aspartate--tRNA ligase [Mycoplasmopsis felis]